MQQLLKSIPLTSADMLKRQILLLLLLLLLFLLLFLLLLLLLLLLVDTKPAARHNCHMNVVTLELQGDKVRDTVEGLSKYWFRK